MILILDASPLIAFYSKRELGHPSLLHELIDFGYQLVVPIAVVEEIRKGHKPTVLVLDKAIEEGKLTIHRNFSTQEISRLMARFPKLDKGETQVLILGKELQKSGKECYCILDEGPATKVAVESQIAKKGTLGILNLLGDLGIISNEQKEKLLNILKQSTFRIKDSHKSVSK